MKKIILLCSFIIFSFSVHADSSSGCGLGWMVFKDQSLVSSTLRNTTHFILPNTFSMTFGTSGCAQHKIVLNEKRAIHFIESNYAQLMIDMAKGSGEYLNALADLTEYTGDREVFGEMVQINYGKLFPTVSTTPVMMYQNFKGIVGEYKVL